MFRKQRAKIMLSYVKAFMGVLVGFALFGIVFSAIIAAIMKRPKLT